MADISSSDLKMDLRTRGCAVCNHLSACSNDLLSKLQFALSADESARRIFADRLDLCPLHLWQLEAVSSPAGASVGHAPLMEHLAQALDRAAHHPPEFAGTFHLAPDSGRCCVCQEQRKAGASYLERLAGFVQEAAGREAYAGSHGLCLKHLAALISTVGDAEVSEFLFNHAARYFTKIATDMRNYGMKTEALRRDLLTEDECDAFLRAIIHTAAAGAVPAPSRVTGDSDKKEP